MFGGHSSSGDLFEIVRRGAGGNCGGMATATATLSQSPELPLELPPTEAEMAAWLCQIVRGDEQDSTAAGRTLVDDNKLMAHGKQKTKKVQTSAEGKRVEDTTRSTSSERKKNTTAEARRSHYAETHSLTEKKRRNKINERIKTLQQLVPGCNKQAMSLGHNMEPASAAVYPVGLPPRLTRTVAAAAPVALVSGHARPAVVLGPPPAMVPLAPLLPLAHYPAIILPAAPMLYPNAAPSPARGAPPPASFQQKE